MRSACSTARLAASLDARASSDLPLFFVVFLYFTRACFLSHSRTSRREQIRRRQERERKRNNDAKKSRIELCPSGAMQRSVGGGGHGLLTFGAFGEGWKWKRGGCLIIKSAPLGRRNVWLELLIGRTCPSFAVALPWRQKEEKGGLPAVSPTTTKKFV